MRQKVKVATGTLNQQPLKWESNVLQILTLIEESKKEECALLLLPELAISGYGCEDYFFHEDTAIRATEELINIAKATTNITVVVGLPVLHNSRLYNVAAVITNTQITHLIPKTHLANDGIHYEKRWFTEWQSGRPSIQHCIGEHHPIMGRELFTLDTLKVGVEICEDAWVVERPLLQYFKDGIDLLLVPSASHFAIGKGVLREQLLSETTRRFGVTVLYSNLSGLEAGTIIYDGDSAIFSKGSLQERLTPLQLPSLALLVGDITKSKGVFTSRLNSIIKADPFNEFTLSVTLGLYDYLRKSKLKGYVLNLSGGADSGSVAILVALTYLRAKKELRSTYFGDLEFKSVLTCIYQESGNNPPLSRKISTTIANDLGATFYDLSITPFFSQYKETYQTLTGEVLDYGNADLPLQNLQARTRVILPWLIANNRQLLFLNTSNRSEIAVGYSTMDGDTAGALNPIGGVSKTFLLEWLEWVKKTSPYGLKLSILKELYTRSPSAELRPLESNQRDEDDLMPYPLLEEIERMYVLERLSPAEITTNLKESYKEEPIERYVNEFVTLFRHAAWKRERFSPSFHLDDLNLSPRSFWRAPIL
jgi:NAD+ synthase (glutamine-hydrolysing)